MRGYRKVVRYAFEVMGETFLASAPTHGGTYVDIEDARKNGQEDMHFYGAMELTDDGWRLVDGVHALPNGEGEEMVTALESFFDEYGAPGLRAGRAGE